MKRFKDILAVYSDSLGSDDVISQSAALAAANGAKLTLVAFGEDGDTSQWRAERQKRLERLAQSVRDEGVGEVEAKLLRESPTDALVREVSENGRDLLLICRTLGKSPDRPFFDRTASKLVRRCPCPVWFFAPGPNVRFQRVLAVLDYDESGGERGPVNAKIAQMASSLAEAHGAALHFARPWEVEGSDYDTVHSELRPEKRQSILEKHEALHRDTLRALIASSGVSETAGEIHAPRGNPQDAIRDLAAAIEADVIVMRADDMSGVSFLTGGSLAETVLNSVTCGLLAVTPDGFAKPQTQGPRSSQESRVAALVA